MLLEFLLYFITDLSEASVTITNMAKCYKVLLILFKGIRDKKFKNKNANYPLVSIITL